MAHPLLEILTSDDPAVRNRPIEPFCLKATLAELQEATEVLDTFRRGCENLYERVRALFFLYAIHRFHLPTRGGLNFRATIPYSGYVLLLDRRFDEAIEEFLAAQRRHGPSEGVSSALAKAYHQLGFQTLADQVRRSVRSVRGNQWMFRMGHPADHPLRLLRRLTRPHPDGTFPILREQTPVRMDLSHSGWSDIFFLGMDYPEGARVLNVSIDLGVHGRDPYPTPPVEAYLRVIDRPVLRLTSIDLETSVEITELSEVFAFGKDYLGLLKAAVIACGLVPPGIEGSGQNLADLMERLAGPGLGLELVSRVNNIPKGSRLAVSTNLLAALIAVGMRATGQTRSLHGGLEEEERRIVAARAILGEWLAGSGGGWQDSGGIWPGIKLIEGVQAGAEDPEFGTSRGCLLPRHILLDEHCAPARAQEKLQESLVLVHGGMAQNVGPILEMVTEKYLLRAPGEWRARQEALAIMDAILDALERGDIQAIGGSTMRNFEIPLQTIIPWATNAYTEHLIREIEGRFGSDFWGFWMLGGMSGGGMGFMFAPRRRSEAQGVLLEVMQRTRQALDRSLPFAMDPVVYDFRVNSRGSWAEFLEGGRAMMPESYYAMMMPHLLRRDPKGLTTGQRAELTSFGRWYRGQANTEGLVGRLLENMIPDPGGSHSDRQSLHALLEENGFDRKTHEAIRAELQHGRIGLAQNRLPISTDIQDPDPEEVLHFYGELPRRLYEAGIKELEEGTVAAVTLAGGVGSRWTHGAGVVKGLNPFCKLGGQHRNFLETHLAKNRKLSRVCGQEIPQVFTTSYLTHTAIAEFLEQNQNYHYAGPILLSPGRAIGLRLVPMVRDLRFAWEEMPRQRLDEQAEKLQSSVHAALIDWAESVGEGSDYTDNLPEQCLHPVGHWYEVPNLLRNGTLAHLLRRQPRLQTLFLHNIDTLGANIDPALLGMFLGSGSTLMFEVITRRLEDRGGGLARVNGRLRLVEGLAMPREEDEFHLSFYNSMTTWIDIDGLLAAFGLSRDDLDDADRVADAVRGLSGRLPTYITLKDVKKRWGYGQEDIFPVAQFEKLWSDMTSLPEMDCQFVVVPRLRGQQLKEPGQLDGWLRDGSADYVASLCDWE